MVKKIIFDGYNTSATMQTAGESRLARQVGATQLFPGRFVFTPKQWDQFNKLRKEVGNDTQQES